MRKIPAVAWVVIAVAVIIAVVFIWWSVSQLHEGLPTPPPPSTYAGRGGKLGTPEGVIELPDLVAKPTTQLTPRELSSLIGRTVADACALLGQDLTQSISPRSQQTLAAWHSAVPVTGAADGWPTGHVIVRLQKSKPGAKQGATVIGVVIVGTFGRVLWADPNYIGAPMNTTR